MRRALQWVQLVCVRNRVHRGTLGVLQNGSRELVETVEAQEEVVGQLQRCGCGTMKSGDLAFELQALRTLRFELAKGPEHGGEGDAVALAEVVSIFGRHDETCGAVCRSDGLLQLLQRHSAACERK